MLMEFRESERGTVWTSAPGGVWLNDWGVGNDGPSELRPLVAASVGNIHLLKTINSEISEMEENGSLSKTGIAERITDFAKERIGPQWQRLEVEIRKANGYADGEEIRLSKPEIDKTDLAGAVMRSNIRDHFAKMSHPQRKTHIVRNQNIEPVVLAALLEAPSFLTGLDDDDIASIRHAHMEAASPGKTLELETIRHAAKMTGNLETAIPGALAAFTSKSPGMIDELLRMRPMKNL